MAENLDKSLVKMRECSCCKDIVNIYEKFDKKKNIDKTIQSFKKYKLELQGELDEKCKSIDCIDYLIYEIERSK